MATFLYKAKSADQSSIDGTIDADSTAAAVQKLSQLGYFPLSLIKHDEASEARRVSTPREGKVSVSDLSATLRQLSDMLDAGLPLVAVLQMATDQASNARLKRILLEMSTGVQEGKTLSKLMGGFPDVFSPFYTHLVYAGETGGMLGTVLTRLADHSEREAEVQSQMRAALAYPAFIVVVGIVTVCFLLGGIIPRLAALFSDFQQQLPLPTRVLLGVSSLFRHEGWVLILLGIAGWAVLKQIGPRPEWRLKRDRLLLKIPGVRRWIANQEIAQFTRTLGALLENGVPVLQSVRVAGQTLGNAVFSASITSLEEAIREGKTLSNCLRASMIFPPYVCNLVAVGEEGGKLDSALLKIAGTYDRQAHRDMKVAMSLIEPILILGIGLILGGVVISIMLPIFEINTLIH